MPEKIKKATLVNARWDDWIKVAANNVTPSTISLKPVVVAEL
jgi:hypothetical protein